MSDFDLLIRSDKDIGIADGKFVAIGESLRGSARKEIDATALSIFPGVIDAHVHFNEPGRTEWEGFETGSSAAAAGGTTTVFEMPLNAHPPTIDRPSFEAKRAAAEASSRVDFGLWGGLVPGNLDQLETLRDCGVIGLKAFMCNSGISDFPHVDRSTLREGMRIAAELGLLVAVHAESEEMTSRLTAAKLLARETSADSYLASRPVEAELDAIREAIELANETGCKLHIVHVSCGRGVDLVAAGRANGVDVTCETCPHYLLLTDECVRRGGAQWKCAPPLRSSSDLKDLWSHLSDVTNIGSDHSPSPPELKQRQNFFEVWGGISGCQHLLPLMMNTVRDENSVLSPNRLADLTSAQVATRFGISHKGGIVIGRDADLTLIDENSSEAISRDKLLYRHQQSAYVGMGLLSRIVRTILRGQTIYRDGKVPARSIGRLVRPQRQPKC
jgi:allantoinase